MIDYLLSEFLYRISLRYENLKSKAIKKRLKSCGQHVYISAKSHIWSLEMLEIEDSVCIHCIHAFTHIFAGNGVKICSGAMISSNVSITSVTHPVDSLKRHCVCEGKAIVIGKSAWIGTGAIILPGITIGDHAVVGSGAVVTKNVAPKTVVVGNPAQFIKEVKKY